MTTPLFDDVAGRHPDLDADVGYDRKCVMGRWVNTPPGSLKPRQEAVATTTAVDPSLMPPGSEHQQGGDQ